MDRIEYRHIESYSLADAEDLSVGEADERSSMQRWYDLGRGSTSFRSGIAKKVKDSLGEVKKRK